MALQNICSRKIIFVETNVQKILEARKKLKLNQEPDYYCEAKMSNIFTEIANNIESKYRKYIFETMGHLTWEDGAISHHRIWKARNNIMPNNISRDGHVSH